MTNEELLEKIDMAYGLISYAETSDKELEALNLKEYFDALRAVVGLFDKAGKWSGQPVISVESLRNVIESALVT